MLNISTKKKGKTTRNKHLIFLKEVSTEFTFKTGNICKEAESGVA